MHCRHTARASGCCAEFAEGCREALLQSWCGSRRMLTLASGLSSVYLTLKSSISCRHVSVLTSQQCKLKEAVHGRVVMTQCSQCHAT